MIFSHPQSLRAHESIHTDDRPFKCDFCPETFKLEILLKLHSSSHSVKKTYKCKRCDFASQDVSIFATHRRKHLELDKKFVCTVCTRRFKTEKLLDEHKNKHPEVLLCEECGFSTSQQGALMNHKKKHEGGGHKCEICGNIFLLKSDLLSHAMKHTSYRPYKCKLCPATYKAKSGLSYHKESYHRQGNTDVICESCGKTYPCKTLLKHHIKQMHLSNREVCDICCKSVSKKEFDNHRKSHFIEKMYACKLCPKAFTSQVHLTRHSRVHNDDNPYECGFCGKAYRHPVTLRVHMRTHEGDGQT